MQNHPPLLCQRSQFSVITIAGTRVDDYLQGQITQDVTGLSCDRLRYSALLTPQGKAVCDLWLAADGERRIVIVPSSSLEAACARLRRFSLGFILTIKPDSALKVWSLQGEGSNQLAHHQPLSWPLAESHDDGRWLLAEARPDIEATLVDEATIEAARIVYGTPRFGVDWSGFPLNANLIERGGISFDKGCFVGQEVASRMRWRGGIRKALCHFKLQQLPAVLPTPICIAIPTGTPTSTPIGTLTSAAMGNDGSCYGIGQLPLETITNADRLRLDDGSMIEILPTQE